MKIKNKNNEPFNYIESLIDVYTKRRLIMDKNNVDIVIKMQNGDPTAFEEIFEHYKVKAVRTAYLITGNKVLAEDIAQEAFIQCYKKIKTLKDPALFKTWFYKILTRIAWRVGTKDKMITSSESLFEISDLPNKGQTEQNYIQNEMSKVIMVAIDKLETKQRMVILLYYYDGFSITEVAKIMNCFEGTVKSRLYAARKNLKKIFDASKDFEQEVTFNVKLYEIR